MQPILIRRLLSMPNPKINYLLSDFLQNQKISPRAVSQPIEILSKTENLDRLQDRSQQNFLMSSNSDKIFEKVIQGPKKSYITGDFRGGGDLKA